LGLNLQTSFLTPPFGFSLFYLKGVAPASVTTAQIYRGIIPFILIQLLVLGIYIFMPDLLIIP
jgi:TRAP-type mannitol/chloroaromatic compound transport system permease large subunit